MKKLIAITLLVFSIVMSQKGNEEGFYWGTTLLHILIAWCTTGNIKNKAAKAITFIAIMSTLIIFTNAMEAAIQTIPMKIQTILGQVSTLYQKIAETCTELLTRTSKKNWENFKLIPALRRSMVLAIILTPLLVLINEGRKLTITNKKNR